MRALPPLLRASVGLLALLVLLDCRRDEETEADPPEPGPPEPVEVRDGQANLLFTYRDPSSGTLATATAIPDIPEEARSSVVIVDLDLSPEERGAARYVHVADLRAPRPDGRYPVAVASRHRFSIGTPPTEAAEAPIQREPVVVYSASWCGVCKKAKRLLRELDVPFEDKDVEASRSAREELAAKAARAGIQPGGVPVIDVRGRLLVGLDPDRLKATLREAGLLARQR